VRSPSTQLRPGRGAFVVLENAPERPVESVERLRFVFSEHELLATERLDHELEVAASHERVAAAAQLSRSAFDDGDSARQVGRNVSAELSGRLLDDLEQPFGGAHIRHGSIVSALRLLYRSVRTASRRNSGGYGGLDSASSAPPPSTRPASP
jgi:hypothetical protein